MTTEASKVSGWLCTKRFSLNVKKITFSIHCNIALNYSPVTNFRGQSLPQTSQIKFTGITIEIDENLSFADHVNSVYT